MPIRFSSELSTAVERWLKSARWFGGKGRPIESIELLRQVPLGSERGVELQILQLNYQDATTDWYWVAWPTSWQPWLNQGTSNQAMTVPAEVVDQPQFGQSLWQELNNGKLANWRFPKWPQSESPGPLSSRLAHFEQSNTSLIFGDRWLCKLFRKLSSGVNPDAEVGTFLAEQGVNISPQLMAVLTLSNVDLEDVSTNFENTSQSRTGGESAAGNSAGRGVSLLNDDESEVTLGVVHRYMSGARPVWDVLGEDLNQLWTAATASGQVDQSGAFFGKAFRGLWQRLNGMLNALAVRTAEMHRGLARSRLPEFAPEPWDTAERDAVAVAQQTYAAQLDQLAARISTLPQAAVTTAEEILVRRNDLLKRFNGWKTLGKLGARTRIHGDFHLGQVLFATDPRIANLAWDVTPTETGLENNLWIIDFEGEPARPLTDRTHKRSPLQDVAGMSRSLHYLVSQTRLAHPDHPGSVEFAKVLHMYVSGLYVSTYRQQLFKFVCDGDGPIPVGGMRPERGELGLIPTTDEDFQRMHDLYVLDKAFYELGYELNNRPDWVQVPLQGIMDLMS